MLHYPYQSGHLNQLKGYILENIKVGVIGVGHLGRFHALNYAQIPQADLVGVYDMDQSRARQVAEESRCKAYGSIEELLKNVDAVSVVVPTDKHFEIGKIVIAAKKHCLMEKPIASDLKEAEELLKRSEEAGITLQTGHVERFNPAYRALHDYHLAPRFIESHRLAPFNPRGTEVAVVLDLMIHDIDMILHLVKSPVVQVDASGVAVVSDTIDIANARLKFENGTVANLTASRISQKTMRKMRVFQKDAYVTIDFHQKAAEIYRLGDSCKDADMVMGEMGAGPNKRMIIYNKPDVSDALGLQIELDVFVNTLLGKSSQGVTAQEGINALKVAMQVLEQLD